MRFSRKLFILIVSLFLFLAARAPANSQAITKVVISQVYGGGGNANATLRSDFIEIFNSGTTSVNLSGWTVQYASASGVVFQTTALSAVTLAPGQYYLVKEADGANLTLPALPTPDATGTIPMSGTSGVVALVTSNIPLVGCGISCSTAPNVVDLVGYGATANAEAGLAAPTLTNGTADIRKGNGCVDTDNNSADFVAGVPAPRNTASALNDCANPATATSTVTPSSTPASPTATATPSSTPSTSARIHDIQGVSHISPLVNQNVFNVPGIVTAPYYITSSGVTTLRGFYMQDTSADSNPSTSEGILVFTSTAPAAVVGDSVLVSGLVSEFRPGGSGGTANLTVTEIASPTVTILTHGNALPAAAALSGPTTVIDDDATGDVETSGTFDQATDGIDYYESFEGMRVAVNNLVVVGPTTSNGETTVLAENGAGAGVRTPRGGILIRPNDFNPERIVLDDEIFKGLPIAMPNMNVTDTVSGSVVGVLDYSFGDFKLEVTAAFSPTSGGLTPEVTTLGASAALRVATFNVENLTPQDAASKYAALGSQVVNHLLSPDVIVIEEIQDNNGTTNNGVVDATNTWNALINAIVTAGGPTYQYRQIDPVNGLDGGAPGGNIRQGFLFNPARVTFVDRAGGTSTTANTVTCVAGEAQLQYSPGRIDPANTAWSASRKPLAGEFLFNGQRLIIIGNHFNSKGGDNPLFGHLQPPVLSSEVQRLSQANVVHNFVTQALTCAPNANIVVLGDLNDFEFSAPIQTLKGTILDNMIETLPALERYSYVFTGNSQVLDQILVSHNLTNAASPQYDVVHINAEFYDTELSGSVRTSDHDPSLVALSLSAPTPTATNTPTATDTATDLPTATNTPTATDTATDLPTATNTPTATDTATDLPTATNTPTATDTATDLPTATNTPTATDTATDLPTATNTPTATDTATDLPTATNTPTATDTATDLPTATNTPTATDTTTDLPTATNTATFTNTPVPTLTATPTDTFTNTPVPSSTATPTNTFTKTPIPTATNTATFTNTPVPTLTATPTNTFTKTPVPPTVTATPSRTNTPSAPIGFYRAYNLGGPSILIDGHTWLAGTASSLNIEQATKLCKQNVVLNPPTDANRAQMIRCSVTGTAPNIEITNVTNGFYDLYFYIWEDNTPSTFNVSIQGGQVFVPNLNSGAAGSWQRMGPYTINVTGGWVSIDSFGGAANFSGIELFRR